MRILHVITSLRTGGAEKLMVDLLPRLRDLGNDVELLLFDGTRTPFYEQLEATGIRIHSLGVRSNMYHPMYLWQFLRFLKTHQYDVVHTHNTAPQLFAACGDVLCSVVLVTTEHNTSNRRRGWTWYRPVDRAMYAAYRRIICISDAAEKNLRDFLRIPETDRRICTIYNGVDTTSYMKGVPDDDLVRLKGGKKALVMVAGFRYQKDHDMLVRAMKLLPECELWLVGVGERMTQMKQLARTEGVADRVRFLGMRTDIPNVLHSADIIVMSSHFEGLSLSSIEGMCADKPFMASNVDGLREITQGYGVLFPHSDEKAFAAEVRKLLEDAAYSNSIARKCLERARQYDISRMAAAYNGVYFRLMHERVQR